ncbi:MAG TPA: high mobility group protein Z [Pantoea sp.]|nr:high mobility group protein Z [Pantoea sp. FDAARGOS_194]HAB24837.1 high mobility group protein Z [Pantoea sp.]HAB74586.1 high mobility group protein Z [Pantoea sp.]HAK33931.1 high mobility group protein Z [Pantoea sp.]
MFWPGSILALLLSCYLIWLLAKLRRLSRLKSRLRRVQSRPPFLSSASRPSLRRHRKE